MGLELSDLSLKQIKTLLADGAVTPQLLRQLQRDPREGVRALHATARRRLERERDERLRLDALLNFERLLWRQGVTRVAGVDEAGTGPLAGPVVAAAVVFPPDCEPIPGIDDSKRVLPEKRVRLAEQIRKQAAVGVGMASVEEIDSLNVYRAALLAMQRAVEALPEEPEHLLVDAREVPGVRCPQNSFEKGDGLDYSIAAASIVAKTHRDALMDGLDRDHPGYGLARHKGYPTADHQDAIRRLGPSPIHRQSFSFIRELCGGYSAVFYGLQRQLETARSNEALTRFEAALDEVRASLSEDEQRKLRLVLARRWKSL